MAQLRRAKTKDGHFYILAGQSQGTWQVTDIGEQWLRANGFYVSEHDESVTLDTETFRYLRDKRYIYILGIDYEQHNIHFQESISTKKDVPFDISLLLRNVLEKNTSWSLAIDLSTLAENEQAWTALQNHHATFVTVRGASSSLLTKRLLDFSTLTVQPQSQPYTIYWEDGEHHQSVLNEELMLPELLSNWKGNVFVKSTRQKDYWYHVYPGSEISLLENICWLARVEQQTTWPGKASRVELPKQGWQLWLLEITDDTFATQQQVKQWLSYRRIKLALPQQRLKIISSVEELIDASENQQWFIAAPSQPLLLQCFPPRHRVQGLTRNVRLAALSVNEKGKLLNNMLQSRSELAPIEQISYFRWFAPQQGRYSLSLREDAHSEPLLLLIKESSPVVPQWLHGLCCTITSLSQEQLIFHAFGTLSELIKGNNEFSNFSPNELPSLTWTIEPVGIPIRILWKCGSTLKDIQKEGTSFVDSDEGLTTYWREQLWHEIAQSAVAQIILDAGSFGIIELSLMPDRAITLHEQIEWWSNAFLCEQFIWLSQHTQKSTSQVEVAVSASLQQKLGQLYEDSEQVHPLHYALSRLLHANTMPIWVIYRLHQLLLEISREKSI